jgi:hypothetical protein
MNAEAIALREWFVTLGRVILNVVTAAHLCKPACLLDDYSFNLKLWINEKTLRVSGESFPPVLKTVVPTNDLLLCIAGALYSEVNLIFHDDKCDFPNQILHRYFIWSLNTTTTTTVPSGYFPSHKLKEAIKQKQKAIQNQCSAYEQSIERLRKQMEQELAMQNRQHLELSYLSQVQMQILQIQHHSELTVPSNLLMQPTEDIRTSLYILQNELAKPKILPLQQQVNNSATEEIITLSDDEE